METIWHLRLLGNLRAERDGETITRFRSQKIGALLAYLALFPRRSHGREELADLLWPDAEPEVARTNLRTALSSLRRQMEPPGTTPGSVILTPGQGTIALNSETVTTDVAAFSHSLQAAARPSAAAAERSGLLTEAINLYIGPLLPGLYETWALSERNRLAEEYLTALMTLTSLREQAGDLSGALETARRVVTADPLNEDAHATVIRLQIEQGQISAANRQFGELERLLDKELGIEPSPEVRALLTNASRTREPERGNIPKRPSPIKTAPPVPAPPISAPSHPPFPAPSAPAAMPTAAALVEDPPFPSQAPLHLPLVMTPFFGREYEMNLLRERLGSPETRLVTLTGPGGSGKTRLVIETVRRYLGSQFPGGVWFVPLAELRDASRLPDAILDTLRLPRSPQASPMDQITEFLRRQEGQAALLIFDNFEHLVDEGSTLLKTLLFWVPDLSCLVTSRQRLQIDGEQEVSLAPLPTPERPGSPERLLEFPSVQLFVSRAQRARPDFQLSTRNARATAALCTRLEGIPLALELAAAWSQILTPSQMLDRLEHRFDLLVSRRRDAPGRHAALRTTLEWSYRLLQPTLQRFYWQISVFRGGWSLEAAAAITGVHEEQALDFLTELRDRSLLVSEELAEGTEMRFRMLETLREFAAEQIPEADHGKLSHQHYRYFLDFSEAAAPLLSGPDQVEWLRRMGREHENLRSALAWSLSDQATNPDSGLELAAVLWWFWLRRGYFREGRRWLESALERCGREAEHGDSAGRALRLQALQGLGSIIYFHGEYPAAEQVFQESLLLARESGASESISFSLFGVAICAMNQVAAQGPDAMGRASAFGQESLKIAELSGSPLAVGRALIPLAIATFYSGEVERAVSQNTRCVAVLREVGEWWDLAIALINQSVLRRHTGDPEGASVSLSEALALSCEENPMGTVWSLWGLAGVAGALDQAEHAARLFGAAAEIGSSLYITVPEVWMERLFTPDREAVRTVLGPARFDELEAEGRAMSLTEATVFALKT